MKYGRSVPGEWTNHELTTVVMPWREVVWGQFIDSAWCEYVCLVNKVADSEPVLVICRPEQYSQALRDLARNNSNGSIIAHPTIIIFERNNANVAPRKISKGLTVLLWAAYH